MSTSIKTPDENPSNVESILSDTIGLPGYTINPPGSRIETLLIELNELIKSGGGGGGSDIYATDLSLTIDSSTYVVTAILKNQNGESIGTPQTIDLPLESVVVGGSYNSQTQKVVLTLQNGNTVEFSVADLVSGLQTELSTSNKLNPAFIEYDSTHRPVSDAEKSTWNAKQNALTTAQLDAVNSGIDSTKVEQIEMNKNNISLLDDLEAEDRAALVELVDSGAKNLLKLGFSKKIAINQTTEMTADGNGVVIDGSRNSVTDTILVYDIVTNLNDGLDTRYTLPAGKYIMTKTGDTNVRLQAYAHDGTNSIALGYTQVSDLHFEYTNEMKLQYPYLAFRIWVSRVSNFDNFTFYPMICTKAAWDISHAYQPYRPSYQELYEQVETNKNNILSLQNSRGVLSDATTIIDVDWTLTTIELIAPANSIVNMTAALVYGAKAPRGIRITRSNTSPTTGVIANIEVSDDETQIITQAIGVKLNGINTYYVWAKAKAATTNVPAYLIYEIH